MTTTLIETTGSKAAYLSARDAWKELAHSHSNTAQLHTRYLITQALYLTDRLGSDGAQAWALRKLKVAFTPSKTHGLKSLEGWLGFEARTGLPFNISLVEKDEPSNIELRKRYQALASFLYDEIRMEGA